MHLTNKTWQTHASNFGAFFFFFCQFQQLWHNYFIYCYFRQHNHAILCNRCSASIGVIQIQSNPATVELCFNEIFPIPLQPATPFNATNSSPQQTICLGCSHFRNFRWLGLKFLLIEAGFEHLFYNKISLKPAFCSFLIHSGPLVSLVSLKTWAVLPNHKQACTACLPRLDATLPSQRIR